MRSAACFLLQKRGNGENYYFLFPVTSMAQSWFLVVITLYGIRQRDEEEEEEKKQLKKSYDKRVDRK